jgi:hypothetical protein
MIWTPEWGRSMRAFPGGVSTPAESESAAAGSAGSARPISFITVKRKHIHLTGPDKYGHWWTEMDGAGKLRMAAETPGGP